MRAARPGKFLLLNRISRPIIKKRSKTAPSRGVIATPCPGHQRCVARELLRQTSGDAHFQGLGCEEFHVFLLLLLFCSSATAAASLLLLPWLCYNKNVRCVVVRVMVCVMVWCVCVCVTLYMCGMHACVCVRVRVCVSRPAGLGVPPSHALPCPS